MITTCAHFSCRRAIAADSLPSSRKRKFSLTTTHCPCSRAHSAEKSTGFDTKPLIKFPLRKVTKPDNMLGSISLFGSRGQCGIPCQRKLESPQYRNPDTARRHGVPNQANRKRRRLGISRVYYNSRRQHSRIRREALRAIEEPGGLGAREDERHMRHSVMMGPRAASHGRQALGTRTPHRCRSGLPAGRARWWAS